MVCILSSPTLFSLMKKRLIILHCVFDFLSVVFVLDICGRTVKLSFLSYGFNGVRQITAGNTHCWGVVRAAVTYFMASLKLFSFPNVEKACSPLV